MYDFLGDLCIDETRGSISVHDPTVRKASHVTGKRSRLDMLLAASGVELIKQTEVADHLTFCSTQVESPLFIKRSRHLPFSVVRTCPVKFHIRERGIEFCRSRKIIKLVFIQGQVRLRHFLGRALRPRTRLSYDTFWAKRCGQDRLRCRALRPHVLHFRPNQLPVSTQASHRFYFSGSTKFNPPLPVLEFYGACAHNRKWQMPSFCIYPQCTGLPIVYRFTHKG